MEPEVILSYMALAIPATGIIGVTGVFALFVALIWKAMWLQIKDMK